MVVALNHMRFPNDLIMSKNNSCDTLDFIFGGHDHIYRTELN